MPPRAPTDDTYEVVRTLALDGGDRRQLRVGLVRAGERQYLEARIYYKNGDGQVLPTRKGVVLTPSNYLALMRVLETESEEIREWLGMAFTPREVRDEASRVSSHSVNRALPSELFWTFIDGGKGGPPYECVHEGSKVTVAFNARNPWVQERVRRCDEAGLRAIAEMAVADDQARLLAIRNSDGDEYVGILTLLDIHRSVILSTTRRE